MSDWECEYCGSTNSGRKCLDCGAPKPLGEKKRLHSPDRQYNLEMDPDYAAAYANTYLGKMEELAYRTEVLKLTIGEALLPAFKRLRIAQ